MTSERGGSEWDALPRDVFVRRFVELYTAAGNPKLQRVKAGADERLRRAAALKARAAGRPAGDKVAGVAVQRISDWKNGRSVPASYQTFEPVLRVLIELALRGPDVLPEYLSDESEWRRVWSRADAWRPGDTVCPYPGLTAYSADRAAVFFGRTEATTRLLGRVEATAPGGLLMLVGASGAGKSSLLAAGVIPVLSGQRGWAVDTLTPGAAPVAALTAATQRSSRVGDDPAAPRLLVVDQLEELFTLCADEQERQRFLLALRALTTRPDTPTVVVCAVRADFYGQCLEHRILQEALADRAYLLGPMTRDELADAITGPARAVGRPMEAGLQDMVIRDLCGVEGGDQANTYDPGALPLLSHVMAAVWEHDDAKRKLTKSGYEAVGGVVGSVAATAERAWNMQSDGERAIARDLLFALVVIGQDCKDTRRTVARADLLRDAPAGADAVLETLAATRVIALDNTEVYLTHEIVLTAWPRLHEWIEEDRVGHLERQRLRRDATEWVAAEHDPSLLYRDTRLAVVEQHASYRLIDGPAKQFLAASRLQRRRMQQRSNRVRATLVLLTVLAVAVAAIALVELHRADTAQQRANTAARLAVALRLAQDGDAIVLGHQHGNDVYALQEILAAHSLAATPQTDAAVLDGEYQRELLLKDINTNAGCTYGVAFSPDRHRVASAGQDGTVRIWSTDTARQIGPPLTGHTSSVESVVFSPDGNRIASSGMDGTVRIWNADTGKEIGAPLIGHAGAVYRVAFSADGHRVASAGEDGTVRIWSTDTGRQIGASMTGHVGSVQGVSFGPDGHRVASSGADGTVRIWDIDAGQEVGPPLTGHAGIVYGVVFSPDGHRLASAGSDDTVRLWDVDSEQQVGAPIASHSGGLNSIAFSPDGHRLVSAGDNGTVRIWDADTEQQVGAPLTGHIGLVHYVAFSPDGHRVASAGDDGTVRIWDADTEQQVSAPLTGHIGAIRGVTYSPDGRRLASAGTDGTVRIWDVDTGREIGAPLTGHVGIIEEVEFSPDGHRVVSSGVGDGTVRLWDVDTGQEIGAPLIGHLGSVFGAAFSPDGRRVASAGIDGTVRIWDVDTGREIGAPLTGHAGEVYCVAFSPDGRRLVSAGADGTVRMWDVDAGREIGVPLTGHIGIVQYVAFSPDGRRVASAGNDGTVRIWSADTGRELGLPLTGEITGIVLGVAFSPDGHRVVSAASDGAIRVWSTDTDQQIGAPLTGHVGFVYGVAYSPDGRHVASSGADGTVRIWNAPAPDTVSTAIAKICAKIGYNMSEHQWAVEIPASVASYSPSCQGLPTGSSDIS